MTDYAIENFGKIKSDRVRYESLRGLSENLPFEDGSVDVAVVSLVLCSVEDQLASLKEVKRVLKPQTGKFIFVEHVLSQTNDALRRQQEALTPMQMKAADGCRLNRKTGEVISTVFGSENVDMEYFDLDGFWVIDLKLPALRAYNAYKCPVYLFIAQIRYANTSSVPKMVVDVLPVFVFSLASFFPSCVAARHLRAPDFPSKPSILLPV